MFWLILIAFIFLCVIISSLFFPLTCQLSLQISDQIDVEMFVKFVNLSVYTKTERISYESLLEDYLTPMLTKKSSPKPKWLKTLRLIEFKWSTKIGLEYADQTALSVSSLMMVKGLITQVIFQLLNQPKAFNYLVQPNYEQLMFQSDCQCIFSLKLWQAIYIKFKRT